METTINLVTGEVIRSNESAIPDSIMELIANIFESVIGGEGND